MSKVYGMTFRVAVDEVDKDDRCQRLCWALSFLDVNTVIGRGGGCDAAGEGGRGRCGQRGRRDEASMASMASMAGRQRKTAETDETCALRRWLLDDFCVSILMITSKRRGSTCWRGSVQGAT